MVVPISVFDPPTVTCGPNSVATVKAFSDRVATISQLTGESARDIFTRL